MLLLSLMGGIFAYILTALSLYIESLTLLLFSRFLSGFMESTFPIARAMASDLISINKFISFGRINTMAALGYILGPLFGGFFSDKNVLSGFAYPIPFLIAAIASFIALVLIYQTFPNQQKTLQKPQNPILQQFNLVHQFKHLFRSHPELKKLLFISTIFTFSVDIFYEFGPVYLAGKWIMTPAQIAIYNAALSITLALGAAWIPRHLSQFLSIKKIIISACITTASIFGCMVIFQYPLSMLMLFALSGLSITTVTTTMAIHLSNTAHASIQSEAMGAQLSLRTLGEALICFIGGLMITISIISPIILSSIIAFIAGAFSIKLFVSNQDKNNEA